MQKRQTRKEQSRKSRRSGLGTMGNEALAYGPPVDPKRAPSRDVAGANEGT